MPLSGSTADGPRLSGRDVAAIHAERLLIELVASGHDALALRTATAVAAQEIPA